MLAQLGETPETSPTLARGVECLLSEQEQDGSWFGRWGMNYIYGAWSALCALNAAGVDPASPAVRRAGGGVAGLQNAGGGWGGGGGGYKLGHPGYWAGASTAPPTPGGPLGLVGGR